MNQFKYPGKLISSLFFAAFFCLGLAIYQDYGISFDEPAQRLIGVTNLNHIAHRFQIDSIIRNEELAKFPKNLNQITDKDYGVVFEVPAAFMEHLFGLKVEREIYLGRHLLTFLFFFAGVLAVYRMAERRFSDWRIGLLAATLLILSPKIFADAFYNSKDLVFLSVFAIAMNTCIGFLLNPNWRTATIHGLACALAIDTRLMAVIIPAMTIVGIFIELAKGRIHIKRACYISAIFFMTCYAFIVLFWPFLWDAPIHNFAQAFVNMAKFRWSPEFLFRGYTVNASNLPWYYLPIWISISTPILYQILFLAGSIQILHELLLNNWRLWKNKNQLQDLIFLGCFIGPIAAIITLHSTLYNGWRHVYFIYPAFILISINGLIFLLRVFKPKILKVALLMSLAISCLNTIYWMVSNHPLQNIYFNALVKNWDQKYEVDYWGLSNKQALEKILQSSKEEKIRAWPGRGYQWPGGWQLPYIQNLKILKPLDLDRIETTESHKDAEFIIVSKQGRRETNTDAFKNKHQYELVDEILVDKTPVISIFKYNPNAVLPPIKSGEKLFFSTHSQGLEYLGNGWQEAEDWGIWSAGVISTLKFPLAEIQPKSMQLHIRALVNPKLPSQRLEIWVNGKLIKTVNTNKPFDNKINVDIPTATKKIELQLKVPNAAKPIDLGINQDDRQIAIGLESIEFK